MRNDIRCIASLLAVTFTIAATTLPGLGKSSPWDGHINAGKQALSAGDYGCAETELGSALQCTASFQQNDKRLGETYYELGQLALRRCEWSEAKQYFERALFIQQKTEAPDGEQVGNTVYGLASAFEQVGDYQSAVIMLDRVLDIWSKLYGPTSPRLAAVLSSMATYATLDSDYKKAQDCYRRLVTIQEKNLGSSNSRVGASLNLLASSIANVGNYAEAEPIAQRAVDVLTKAPDSPTSLDSATATLSYIRQRLGKAPLATEPADIASKQSTASSEIEVATKTSPVKSDADSNDNEPAPPPAIKEKAPAATTVAVTVHKEPENKPVEIDHKKLAANPPLSAKVPAAQPERPKQQSSREPAASVVPPTSVVPQVPPTTSVPPISSAPQSEKKDESSKPSVVENKDDITVHSSHIMRAPNSSIATTADEFKPWELRNATHQGLPGAKGADQNTNWGKIRYLAGGRLISPEQYKAMLLANEAYELIRTEKYLMAVQVLKNALTIYPDMASGHSNLGLALSELGRNDEAIENLQEAIAIDPTRSAPWLNLASAFQMTGQLRASVATYDEFVRRFPNEHQTAKAREVAAHLHKELTEQEAVASALGREAAVSSDYYAYASHNGVVRWPAEKNTIKVFISSGSGVPGFKSEYGGFFADSCKQWSVASKNLISFQFVKTPDASDIECMWTDDPAKVSSPAEGGETRVLQNGKTITHATVTVLTCGPTADSTLSATQVRAVCLHEMGHALGLVGHSPKPTDVMYCSVPPASAKIGISDRDTATIQRLYSGQDSRVSWQQ